MSLSEFELIQRFFADLGPDAPPTDGNHGVALGVGDDCALLRIADGEQLAISVDTLVAGVHFPGDANPADIARRALRVNLSDLAAMGADPLAFTLALTLPAADEAWLASFARGLRDDARHFGIPLVGGDTTRGNQLVITLQVMGTVPERAALTRHGARPGDLVLVSGHLGDAALALDVLAGTPDRLTAAERDRLLRYWLPEPRLSLGRALRPLATAAIDVSDGLAADLGHILERSGVGAAIDIAAIPLSGTRTDRAIESALYGGDDYELCFTIAPARREAVRTLAAQTGAALTPIGTVTATPGLYRTLPDGTNEALPLRGYRHF